jgi:hypothetical protein
MPASRRRNAHHPLHARLNAALAACGYPPLRDERSFRRLGAGAWHDAFRAITRDGQRLVVRLRKATIYGRQEPYDAAALHSDYAGVGVYYAAANACRPGTCPTRYRYAISPAFSCTVESYLGPTLALDRLTVERAFAIGREIGATFRALHTCPAPCGGWGEMIWMPDGMRGEDTRPRAAIEEAEQAALRDGLARLVGAGLIAEPATARRRLDAALARRAERDEPPALVNGDITPENIIVRRGRLAGLVDPVPRIGGALRYAAFFPLCYRLYLPALHDAPRYARHRYDRVAPIMARLADGYTEGYVNGDASLASDLRAEYWLWLLDIAVDAQTALEAPMTEERRIRTGGYGPIARRLREFVRAL